jgi:hypothetical protein
MVFSYCCGQQQKSTMMKIAGKLFFILWPWQYRGTTWFASHNGLHPGLHWKPLDAVLGKCMHHIALVAT